MADIKISQLSEAQTVSDTDVFPMTSNGVTMKAPASAIKDYMGISDLTAAIAKCEVLVINVSSFSSLPQTVTDTNIESDMVVINSVLDTPSAQTGDWTVTTANGSLTISGTINGSTTATLYLMKSR